VSDGGALTVPVPGWYPDRNEANTVRWWDGGQWTDHTQSIAPAAAAFEQPVSAAAFGFGPVEQQLAVQPIPVEEQPEIAPGWYTDNADATILRWWDGTQWTAHTTPVVGS
jgi:hypothetical protein